MGKHEIPVRWLQWMVAKVHNLLSFVGRVRKVTFLEDSMQFCGYLYTDPSRLDEDPWRRYVMLAGKHCALATPLLSSPCLWINSGVFFSGGKKDCEVMIQNNVKEPLLLHKTFVLNLECVWLVWQQAWQHRMQFFPNQLVSLSCG